MSKSKNDIAWEKIFEKYCILDKLANNERISISSTEINQFREARLMTKFDHRSQLPKLFIDHNLSILPTSMTQDKITTISINSISTHKNSFPINLLIIAGLSIILYLIIRKSK